MVQEGYSLFNAGRTNEALLIAHAAVEENPNSSNAQSLLGMCFERMGQIAEALECFERVLQLTPDSSLDRMKVTQLRSSLTNHMKTDNRRNQKFAAVAGLSMLVLVIAAGVVFANTGSPKVAQTTPSTNPTDAKTFTTSPMASALQSPQATAPVTTEKPVDIPTAVAIAMKNERDRMARLNNFGSGDDIGDTVPPVRPTVPVGGGLTNITAQPTGGDPAPTPDGPQKTDNKNDAAQAPPAAPDPEKGIQISVLQPRASSAGDSGGSPGNELSALMKTAKNQFIVGQYDKAVGSYQRALQNGGDPGIINQRLGMCFEKLGKQSDAAAAYSQAAASYESEINAGRGDSKRLKSGLDSVRQALKLLKG